MITRFRVEVLGISQDDCQRQLSNAVTRLKELDHSMMNEWDVTDDVCWRDGLVYRARRVLKRKEAARAA